MSGFLCEVLLRSVWMIIIYASVVTYIIRREKKREKINTNEIRKIED